MSFHSLKKQTKTKIISDFTFQFNLSADMKICFTLKTRAQYIVQRYAK